MALEIKTGEQSNVLGGLHIATPLFYPIRDCLQIPLLMLNKFRRINLFLFLMKSSENGSLLQKKFGDDPLLYCDHPFCEKIFQVI